MRIRFLCCVYIFTLSLLLPEISTASLTDDAFEPNDTFATAATITAGNHSLVLSNNGASPSGAVNERDWFKVTGLRPGLLYVKLEHPDASPVNDLNLIIYNDAEQVVLAENKTNETEELFYHIIVGGTYYIQVNNTNGGEDSYILTVSRDFSAASDDSDENNDYFDMATPIVDYNQTITGKVAKDEDWYSFSAPPGTFTVTVSYDNSAGELTLEAYYPLLTGFSADSRRNLGVGSGGLASVEAGMGDAGVVKLAVIGRAGTTYSLSIAHPIKWMTELTGEHASGPAHASCPTIADIDSDGNGEIIIGTRALVDENSPYTELKLARLVVLEEDGTIKWSRTFPASSEPDPITGAIYTSTGISSRPAVDDIDGDGDLEIVVSVGVDLDYHRPGTQEIYAPGHIGGVYAVDASTGEIEWSRISKDINGVSGSDTLSDGVISSPVICDVDQDGIMEIAWGSWDHHIYLVDGRDGSNYGTFGASKWPVDVHDTNWSTPLFADINDDGLQEILIGGDITENPEAFTLTGGIFHVFDRFGRDIIAGFRTLIEFNEGSDNYSFLKGKYEEQTIWSSPIAADLDGDGNLEIAYGTGLFFPSPKGEFVRIWNHDGTPYLKLATQGRTFAVPLFADLDSDGDLEIIAVTDKGWVQAWDHLGTSLFTSHVFPSGSDGSDAPLYSAPLAVDLDKDNDLEIILQQGVSLVIVDHNGNQLTDSTKWGMTNEHFRGTPAIDDLDNDGNLEIITGGSNAARDTGVVYCFQMPNTGNAIGGYAYARRQFREIGVVELSDAQIARRTQVENFVSRFYTEVLGRTPDSLGLSDWTNRLLEGDRSGADVARGFVLSSEFINQNTSDTDFLTILYLAFFNRSPDQAGFDGWLSQLQSGTSRLDILNGFLGAQEFLNLCNSFNIARDFTATEGLNRVLVTEFVTRFYNQVLLRQPDTAGLNLWVDQLMLQSLKGADVAYGFVFSQEFINRNLNDTDFVNVLYRAFFGRSADSGGLAAWVTALEGGMPRSQVVDGFTQSDEFINLANSFGIAPF